jgi:hypothetical protein
MWVGTGRLVNRRGSDRPDGGAGPAVQRWTPMKRLVFATACLLAIGSQLKAATSYTVKAGGGGNFTTIQACVNAMVAGDTCVVFAGTYNERVTVSAGSAGNYKTVAVNGGDTVNVFGFTVNSHTKVIGFHITNPSSPNSGKCVGISANATDWYITNNVMTSCGSGEMIGEPLNVAGTGFGYIQGNTLSWGCSTPSAPNVCEGMMINGDHHLIEGNDISHVSDGVTNYGSFNVYRNNTMHDTSPNDCGSNSSNCHIDFIESEPNTAGGVTRPAAFLLYEGNFVTRNLGSNAHVFLTQADACGGACNNVIIRYNAAYQLGTYWLLDQLGNFSHVKDYNNTIVCALDGSACGVSGVDQNVTAFFGSTNGAEVNNIYYKSTPLTGSGVYYAGSSPFRANNNLAFCSPLCSFISPFSSEVGRLTNQDPKFVDPTADWHLQAGSPAIGAGANLTTASGSGSNSTTLVVSDADYFQDGLGLTAVGVQPDWIRVGTSATVQITSINYATHTITLAQPMSWSSGAAVSLAKDSRGNVVLSGSSAPDVGAFPSGSVVVTAPRPPTNVRIIGG